MIPETAADLVADHRAYAAALRAHLAPPRQGADRFAGWRGVRHRTTEEQCAADAGLMGELHAGGWNRVGWPAEAGGLGGDVRHRAVLYDELVAAGLAIPLPSLVLEVLGPTLARFAPALAAELLPRALAGLVTATRTSSRVRSCGPAWARLRRASSAWFVRARSSRGTGASR